MSQLIFDHNKFLDFHTHSMRHAEDNNVIEIISVHLGQEKESEYFTIGMHPWWTKAPVTPAQSEELVKQLQRKNCLAMGEMGLDNLKGAEMNQQMDILRSPLSIAEQQDKPVIIHCVRAFNQLIQIKKEFPKIKNWCVHGYGRHVTLAKQLIDQGFYLSLMPTMPLNKYQELIDTLPIERIFLETDSMAEADIVDIYSNVSTLLKMEVSDLCRQMNRNAKEFFRL